MRRDIIRRCFTALATQPGRRAAVCLLVLFAIASGVRAQDPQPVEILRIDSNLVSVPVIVSDRENRYLPGLKLNDFKLYDNSTQQQIVFFDAAEEPLNVALLLDTSRSTEGVLKEIKDAAKEFLKELRPQDRAMVVSFDFAIHHLSVLTNDRKVLEKAIKHAEVGEFFGTTLNDAVSEIIDKDFKPITGRKAIILLTDGEDAGSRITGSELLASAAESDTMIYSIYYESELGGWFRRGQRGGGRGGGFPGRRGSRPFSNFAPQSGRVPQKRPDPAQPDQPSTPATDTVPRSDPSPQRGQRWPGNRRDQRRERREERRNSAVDFLTKLSEETSGRFYRSDVADLKKSFDLIAQELRYQYRLGFYPKIADGSLHYLKVSVDRDDVAIRARRQYRTAKSGQGQ